MSTSTKPQGRGLVMAAVFIATFMTSVEVTIVTTALPAIISDLHGLAYQSWIMSAYLLTTAITTPIYGKLADTLERRGVFQWGVVLFTLGTLLSGLAPHILLLILARAARYWRWCGDAINFYHHCGLLRLCPPRECAGT